MNGLDVYERYKAAEKQIKRKEEQIARRGGQRMVCFPVFI